MSKKNLGNYGGTKSALKAGTSTEHALIHGEASLGGLARGGNNVVVDGQFRNEKRDGTEQVADFSGARGKHDEVSTPKPRFNTIPRKANHS